MRALQHTLYRTAKADPGRRFHALWDKVVRRDVLWRGRVAVRAGNGAPGIDKTTLDQIEHEYGALRLAIFAGKRHKRGRRFGLNVVAYLSPDRCGLISMSGVVVPPRADKPWREKPHAAGERRR